MLARLGIVLGNLGFIIGLPFLLLAAYVAIKQPHNEPWLLLVILCCIGGGIWKIGSAAKFVLRGR